MLIILYGPDTFRSRIKLREIENAYRVKHPQAAFLERLDGSTISFFDLTHSLHAGSLFDATRLVVVEDAATNSELIQKVVEHKVAQGNEITLIFLEEVSLGKAKEHKQLLHHADKCEEFKLLVATEAVRWFSRYLTEKNMNLDPTTIRSVFERCRGDMWQIANELEKIWTYTRGRTVNDQILERLGIGKPEAQLFPTIDAVFARCADEAIYHLQLHWHYGEHPHMIFTMLERQLKLVALIKEAEEQKQNTNALATTLKLHPFVVKKTLQLTRHFSWQKIQTLYERIASLDEKAKTGKLDAGLATELLALAICV